MDNLENSPREQMLHKVLQKKKWFDGNRSMALTLERIRCGVGVGRYSTSEPPVRYGADSCRGDGEKVLRPPDKSAVERYKVKNFT